MIAVTHRLPGPDSPVGSPYQIDMHHGVHGMEVEHDGQIVFVYGRQDGANVRVLLAVVQTDMFVAAAEPHDDLMALADAVQQPLPFAGDGHPGFIEPSPAVPIDIGDNVRSLLGSLGERAAATRRTHDTDDEKG